MDDAVQQAGTALDWANRTTLHPLGLALVLFCGVAMLLVPRRYATWPMIAMACLVAPAQRLVVAGLDFDLLRIMVLFAVVRLLARNETNGFVFKPLDGVLLMWAIAQAVVYTAQVGQFSALINRAGAAFDAIGMYFVFRCLVRTWDDFSTAIGGFMLMLVPISIAFVIESQTGRNMFAFFGGVPAITVVREGRLRCQGAFAHPILAGCFWAAIMPLIAARWWLTPQDRRKVITALVMCLVVVVCCASSTPVMAVAMGCVGGVLYYYRSRLTAIRWGVVLLLVCLHLVMKAPVWHLIARISAVGGSTGYHRYLLIDNAIKHFGQWWLLGTRSTAEWGYGQQDVTNYYLYQGVLGGIWSLGLFVAVLVLAFRAVGRALRLHTGNPPLLIASWSIGVALFIHAVSFISVTYFGQIIMVWYLTLALAASLAPSPRELKRALLQRRVAAAQQHAEAGGSLPAGSWGGRLA